MDKVSKRDLARVSNILLDDGYKREDTWHEVPSNNQWIAYFRHKTTKKTYLVTVAGSTLELVVEILDGVKHMTLKRNA